ncbi:hypothetical protein DV735_g5286, partial [Chaetothyriales sp. CBS 134920]
MHNVLSRDCMPPAEFRQIASDQIKKYGTTEFIETEIKSVERVEQSKKDNTPSHFEVVDPQVRALGCHVDTGKIKNLEPAKAPEVGVTIVFEDGRHTKVGYLVDRPTTVLSGRHLIDKLGLEIEPHPVMGEHVKVVDFAGSTNVPGVFVVGDASTPLKAVANAMSSGANAAAGIAQQLAAEELQRLLESSSVLSL